MESNELSKQAHCLVLPCPFQGQINPMLQFSKRLQQEGWNVTMANTQFCYKNLQKLSSSIALESIFDGFENGVEEAESFKAYLERFQVVGTETLTELVEKLGRSGNPVNCIVYNSFLPWALDVAKKFGLVGVAFFTQSLAVNSLYYHFHLGNLQVPSLEQNISLPGLPLLQPQDLPSVAQFEAVKVQFSNIDRADWILSNTFYELEKEVIDWLTKIWPKLRAIGPTIPSMFLGKPLKGDEDYGLSFYNWSEECLKWLDDRSKGSVVYVSFGSLADLKEEQMEELAWGLRDSGSHFLWIVRDSEKAKLPKDFVQITEKDLVVTWCPQLKVLAHEAVGCFLTHCGWNSTLEAMSFGVPLIAMPQWIDQGSNAKHIADVWKMGIRAWIDEKGIVRREVLMHCIREMMVSERGKEMKRNALKWKTLAAKAVDKGGSSYENITEYVSSFSNF